MPDCHIVVLACKTLANIIISTIVKHKYSLYSLRTFENINSSEVNTKFSKRMTDFIPVVIELPLNMKGCVVKQGLLCWWSLVLTARNAH